MKKTDKTTSLGFFTILKESSKKFITWDVEMDEDLKSFMEKVGREEAEKDTFIFVNIGFNKTLEKFMQQKKTSKKKKS